MKTNRILILLLATSLLIGCAKIKVVRVPANTTSAANGVIYAYGSGESTTQRWAEPGHVGGSQGRILESTHAVLYALDGETGDELWSSKDQITSWNHFSGLSVANGRVYIGTFDGMLYCFGL